MLGFLLMFKLLFSYLDWTSAHNNGANTYQDLINNLDQVTLMEKEEIVIYKELLVQNNEEWITNQLNKNIERDSECLII